MAQVELLGGVALAVQTLPLLLLRVVVTVRQNALENTTALALMIDVMQVRAAPLAASRSFAHGRPCAALGGRREVRYGGCAAPALTTGSATRGGPAGQVTCGGGRWLLCAPDRHSCAPLTNSSVTLAN